MATLNQKIRDIISAYKISDRQFAIKIGVTQSVIGSMFQKNTEPSSKVIRNTLAAFPEISADWFLRDIGEMLKSQSKEVERINSLLDTIATLQESINAKNDTISALSERVKQLESQLSTK
ncbi:MAG: helix-turn-helix transcriptional regulator [Muribaculaceae bacterium]